MTTIVNCTGGEMPVLSEEEIACIHAESRGCNAQRNTKAQLVYCTRSHGHSGRHIASGYPDDDEIEVFAIWDDRHTRKTVIP